MSDLKQRAERVIDSLAYDRCPACDNKYGTTPDQQWYCEGCGERWETSNEAADLIRELLAENERLRDKYERIPDCDAGWDAGPNEHEYREVGPTPLRGRVTRRDE